MFDNCTILLFWLQTFRTSLLHDLRFVLCSLDLDLLGAHRIIGFFIWITHKSMRSENRDYSQIVYIFAESVHNIANNAITNKAAKWYMYSWQAALSG